MSVLKNLSVPLREESDLVRARHVVRQWATELGFSLVEQTKVVTAASELARNTIIHGGGGAMLMEALEQGARHGLRLTFEDQGQGIPDIEMAMKDGYTTGSGLGLGLGGAKRLSGEFHIESEPGRGTRVVIVRWK
jgi:serine/threonine-protein kinase RsbT